MKHCLLLFSMTLFVLCSCSDKADFSELQLEKQVSVVITGGNKEIQIVSGSGDYSLSCEDANVVLCELQHSDNTILIYGLGIGETRILVKDNKSMQEKNIRVKVIPLNGYVSLKVIESFVRVNPDIKEISTDILKNNIINAGYFITLIPDKNKVFIFNNEESLKTGNVMYRGTYQLSKPEDSPKTLDIQIDGVIHSCSLVGQSYFYLYTYLLTRSSVPARSSSFPLVSLQNNLTDLYLNTFPDLESASMFYNAHCYSPLILSVPAELFFE